MMLAIRHAVAYVLIKIGKLGKWVQPNAGPIGEDPK